MGHEWGHGHVVQTLQLPDEDPGDAVQHCEKQHQRTHSHQEPREHTADDTEAEEDQDDILDEHLSLEGQTSVDWKENTRRYQ